MPGRVVEVTNSREDLIQQAIRTVARSGVDGLSLRKVAASAGVSTASIFHFFGNKASLLAAAAEEALAVEIRFHQAFAGDLAGLQFDELRLADLIVSYMATRQSSDISRFWLEMVFSGGVSPAIHGLVGSWRGVRQQFWTGLTGDPLLARLLVDYLLMEEAYAVALHDDVTFWPLAAETARVISARLRGAERPREASNAVGTWLLAKPQQFSIGEPEPANEGASRLLRAASERIFAAGLGAVNDREIGRLAGMAPSMIAYNFENSAAFLRKAVWRAILHEIPGFLDPAIRAETRSDDLDDWATVMTNMVTPGAKGEAPGFYLGYTRIAGQAALLSARQKDLVPLIRHLRTIEGTGTYRACQLYWPRSIDFGAAEAMAFGIWIKGASITNNITNAEKRHIANALKLAAAFFSRARSSPPVFTGAR